MGGAMREGLGRLQKVRELLILPSETDGSPRHRLQEGAREFWTAIFYIQNWPADLQSEMELVLARLFAGGVIETTIAGMSDEAVEAMSRAMLSFIDAAEQRLAADSPLLLDTERSSLQDLFSDGAPPVPDEPGACGSVAGG